MYTDVNSRSLELDIREHIQLFVEDVVIVDQLAQKYQEKPLVQNELQTLGLYFYKTGNGHSFVKFCLRRMAMDLEIPWALFAASVYQSSETVPAKIRQALMDGAQETERESELARFAEIQIPAADRFRNERRSEFARAHEERVGDLLSQVDMLRIQEMEDDEERVLLQLLRLTPKDDNIYHQHEALKERKAIRILEARLQDHQTPWDHAEQIALDSAERRELDTLLNSLHLQWSMSGFEEDLGHDFAIALMMWDYPEAALDFLPEQSTSPRILWTRMEALSQARHFVALLNHLERAELLGASDPESTFALLYLKALALWGLGHRFSALEIVEGIVNHRPNYRSAMTLLHLWKGGTA